MKFYALHDGVYEGVNSRITMFKTACKMLNVEFIAIDNQSFDYTNVPKLTRQDLLYKFARGAQPLESLLLNDKVTTLLY